MIVHVVMWLGAIVIVFAGTTFTVMARQRMPQNASLRGTLGYFPLAAFIFAALTAVFGLGVGVWVSFGEKHTVTVHEKKRPSYDCTFTWPTSSAAAEQSVGCNKEDWRPGGSQHVAVRVPGTDFITLLDHSAASPFDDDFSGMTLAAAYCMIVGGGMGVARNALWSSRRTSDDEQARLARWQRVASSPSTGPDLTWSQIAQRSEAAGIHGGPLVHPTRFTGIAPTSTMLPMQYPYSYARVLTREPEGRSIVLLFVGEGAWRLDVDGVPAAEGTATVSRVPARPSDLVVTIDDYVYDIADAPMFLPAPSLEALRRYCSQWVSSPESAPQTGRTETSQESH